MELPASLVVVAAASAVCKCCGHESPLFGVTDFARNCNSAAQAQKLTGIPIYYHRCPQCGFIFTTAFDAFSESDWRKWIYNDEYSQVDPDFLEKRSRENADRIARIFGGSKDISILDYGGGMGVLAKLLRERGFSHVDSYDPLIDSPEAKPQGQYDLVTAFEVVEHSTQPRTIFSELASFRNEPGMVLFSTPMQPAEMIEIGMNAWFLAPRNGHVSIHTELSVQLLVRQFGLRLVCEPRRVWHLLLGNQTPEFARHLNLPPP